jgi:uncharacterized protein (DUF305 family)
VLGASVIALVLASCGGGNSSTNSGSSSTANASDRAFATAMIPHHRSAVAMAQIAETEASHPEIKRLAKSIVTSPNTEITQMNAAVRRFEKAGIKEGDLGVPDHAMGMEDDPAALETAEQFDREFIDMMIPHHQGAIRMARAERKMGKDPEMLKLAKAIEAAQTREIDQMNLWRVSWYGGASPAGGVPAENDMEGMNHGM